MNTIEEYVDRQFRDIPDSERKSELMSEIKLNLMEKVADLTAHGKAEEDAVNKAIVDFGDIGDIRTELVGAGNPDALSKKVKQAGLMLGYSIWGSVLIIALVLFINFYYSPHAIWFAYPTFAVLWWPLTMFYHWLRLKREADSVE